MPILGQQTPGQQVVSVFLQHGGKSIPDQPSSPATILNDLAEVALTAGMCAIAVFVIVAAVVLARRHRTVIPLVCVVSGLLCACIEPLVDVGLQVWWMQYKQPLLISAFGCHVPVMLLAAYTWMMGGASLLIWTWLRSGNATARKFTRYYFAVIVALNFVEPVGIALHAWLYQGQQGPRFLGYPIYYSVSVTSMFVAGGCVIFWSAHYLTGWRQLLMIPLLPMIDVGVNYATAWPMYLALNTEPHQAVTYLCALLSVAQGFIVFYLSLALVGLVKPVAAPAHPTTASTPLVAASTATEE